MIRVGFILNFEDNGWIGGVNYFRNLFNLLISDPKKRIIPVIFTGYRNNKMAFLSEYSDLEIIQSRIFDTYPTKIFHYIWIQQGIYNKFLEHILLKHDVRIVSHSGDPGERNNKISYIGWIPDFQHKYLPEFFNDDDIKGRDASFKKMFEHCTLVILSSHNAKTDATKFFPEFADKSRVLQFVTGNSEISPIQNVEEIQKKYGIQGQYFILPNQFWIHKNHRTVIEALRVLNTQGKKVQIVCTGNTADPKRPEYFNTLIYLIKNYNISDHIKILGIIPYPDLITLTQNSIALINPSFFEGWSTTIEEAKSLGLRVVLSDIPVHREQNPHRGIFFDKENAEQLAAVLWSLWTSNEPNYNPIDQQKAKFELNQRKIDFVNEFCNIVYEALNITSPIDSKIK